MGAIRIALAQPGARSRSRASLMTTSHKITFSALAVGLLLAGACGKQTSTSTSAGLRVGPTPRPPGPLRRAEFNRDILPILQQRCQNCHGPGGTAPMALTNYREARPWAKSISELMGTRHPFTEHAGGDRSLPPLRQGQKNAISNWVRTGAVRGKVPAPPTPDKGGSGACKCCLEQRSRSTEPEAAKVVISKSRFRLQSGS